MTDVYAFWRAAPHGHARLSVAVLPTIGAPIALENPQPGLWKVRLKKDGPYVLMHVWLIDEHGAAVHQWRDGLSLAGTIAGKPADSQEIVDRWLHSQPVTKDEAAHWREHGRWPADPEPLPPRTHNQPSDPFEALTAEVDDRIAQVQQWLTVNAPIGDQTACDKARNMQAALLELNKRADVMFEAEKRPHLEAGRAVDRKFGFRKAVEDWAGRLRVVFEQFMRAEERRQHEAAEKAFREEQARAEAERARVKAERAQKLADDPVAALTEPEPALPEAPLAPEPVKVQAGGGVGRRAGLKDDWEFEIVDYKLAALHVIEQPDVSAAVGKVIARLVRAAKGRVEIPGVKVNKVRRAA